MMILIGVDHKMALNQMVTHQVYFAGSINEKELVILEYPPNFKLVLKKYNIKYIEDDKGDIYICQPQIPRLYNVFEDDNYKPDRELDLILITNENKYRFAVCIKLTDYQKAFDIDFSL